MLHLLDVSFITMSAHYCIGQDSLAEFQQKTYATEAFKMDRKHAAPPGNWCHTKYFFLYIGGNLAAEVHVL